MMLCERSGVCSTVAEANNNENIKDLHYLTFALEIFP